MRRADWHRSRSSPSAPTGCSKSRRKSTGPTVWMGVSVESREYLGRIDRLRRTGARVKFLSIEPLLEDLGEIDLTGIDWAIVGGESGPGARPMNAEWVRNIRRAVRQRRRSVLLQAVGRHKKEGRGTGTRRQDLERNAAQPGPNRKVSLKQARRPLLGRPPEKPIIRKQQFSSARPRSGRKSTAPSRPSDAGTRKAGRDDGCHV